MTTLTKNALLLVLATALVAVPVTTALGAPYVYITMLGRVGGGAYGPVVGIHAGDTIEYQVFAQMTPATLPVTNASIMGIASNKTLSSLVPNVDGVHDIKFHIYETSSDAIQLTLNGTLTADGNWGAGSGAVGGYLPGVGTYTLPAGYRTTVRNIRTTLPTSDLYTAIGSAVPIGHGTATVGDVGAGTDSTLQMGYNTAAGAPWYTGTGATGASQYDAVCGIKINGGATAIGGASYTDPVLGINNLVVYLKFATADAKVNSDPNVYEVDYNLGGTTLEGGGTVGTHATVQSYEWDVGGLALTGASPMLSQGQLQDLWNGAAKDALGWAHIPLNLTIRSSDGELGQSGGQLNIIPEPATLALLGLGLAGLISRRRRS